MYDINTYYILGYGKTLIGGGNATILIAALLVNIVGAEYSKYCGAALIWRIQAALLYIVYFAIGYVYRKIENKHKINTSISCLCLLMVCYLLIVSQFHKNTVIDNSIGDVAISTIGMFVVVVLSMKIEHCKTLEFIGQNTLVYYAFQSKFIKLLEIAAVRFGLEKSSMFVCVGITLLTGALLIIPAIIVNNFFPFLLGRKPFYKALHKQNQ